jgi:hypothetical protein
LEPSLSSDEGVNRYFDRITLRLQEQFGYSADEAVDLVRRYYALFRDPSYCAPRLIAVQDDDYFFQEGEFDMTLRIHYYLGISGDPHPQKFIEWRKNYYLQQ